MVKKVSEQIMEEMAKRKREEIPISDEPKRVTEKDLKDALPKGFTLLKTAASRADLLYAVNKHRLAEQNKLKEYSEFEVLLNRWFIENLVAGDSSGVAGKIGRVEIKKKDFVSVADWNKFNAYVKRNKADDLLTIKANDKAIKERWEDGKQIPGIEKGTIKVISLTKVKG